MSNSKEIFTLSIFIFCISSKGKCFANDFVRFQAFPADLRMTQDVPYQQEVNLVQCGLLCAYNDTCSSVNYNNGTKICELNTLKMKSREYRVQQDPGWKIYEKLPCGLGYMNGARCRHIQNLFEHGHVTYQMAADFCHLLGEHVITLENEQDKADLESNAISADIFRYAYIWVGTRNETKCTSYRREYDDTVTRSCELNAAVVCERP